MCWRFPSSAIFFLSKIQHVTRVVSHSTQNCHNFPSIFLITPSAHFFSPPFLHILFFFLVLDQVEQFFLSWTKGHKIKPHAVLSLVQMFAWRKHTHSKCHHSCALCVRCDDRSIQPWQFQSAINKEEHLLTEEHFSSF